MNWTPEHIELLKKEYATANLKELAGKLNCSIIAIKCKAQVLKLRRINLLWPEEKVEILKKLYPTTTVANLAKLLGIKENQVVNKASRLGLKKDPEFKLKCALSSGFKKGRIPANKGKRIEEFMTPETIKKFRKTQYKKGQSPNNNAEIGSIKKRKDSLGKEYLWIKTGNREDVASSYNWTMLHVYIWEKENGPIPKNLILWFKDKNPMNCTLENLELITRSESMLRNSCSMNLTDNYVARTIVGKNGTQEEKEMLLEYPELIDLKRKSLQLKRAINGTEKK